MADATVANVLADVRSLLGDDQVSGGEVFTDTMLQVSAFPRAYRDVWRALSKIQAPRVKREAFYVVPANTDYLHPSTANITDMSQPSWVGERGNLTQKTITGATGTTTVSITATTLGFSTGDMITVNGIVGFSGTEGMWGITVSDASTFVLNGAIGSGTYSSGGKAVKSTEDFTEVIPTDRLGSLQSTANADAFRLYVWQSGALHFPACNAARQLRIEYWASGSAPTSTSANLGIDDSRDLTATLAAAYAIGSRGGVARRDELLVEAFGPSMQPDAYEGMLGMLIDGVIKRMQRAPVEERRRLSFRERISRFYS